MKYVYENMKLLTNQFVREMLPKFKEFVYFHLEQEGHLRMFFSLSNKRIMDIGFDSSFYSFFAVQSFVFTANGCKANYQ